MADHVGRARTAGPPPPVYDPSHVQNGLVIEEREKEGEGATSPHRRPRPCLPTSVDDKLRRLQDAGFATLQCQTMALCRA